MASTKIRGITIELGADTTQLTEAFKKVTKDLSSVDKQLKDVNKLLKLDPTNVELLSQKQKYLEDAIALSTQKLEEEQKMLNSLPSSATGELTDEQMALAREIEATKIQLEGYQKELEGTTTDTQQADKATEDYGKQQEKTSDKLAKAGQVLTGLQSGFQMLMGAIRTIKQVYDTFIGDTVKLADDLMVQAQVTGLSTDALQEYAYMAELVDTDVNVITGSMTKMVKNMATATKGTGDAYKAFEKLGVAVTDSNGEMRDQNDVFAEVIQALGQMTNETERDALSMQIFGKSARELNPLIEAGADNIEEFRQQAHEMGYVLDEETLGALGSVDDNMQMLKNNFESAKRQIATGLLPIVLDITNAFVEWAGSVDWQQVGAVIKKVMETIAGAIQKLKPVIDVVIEVIGWLLDKLHDLFTAKWEIPKIKLPHFKVTGSLNPLNWFAEGLPKISIDWYKKGMEGMVLDRPTIFGINKNGQLMAGGEAGREIIIGEDKLKSLMSGTTINIVINESNNPEATAEAVATRMQLALASEGRVWK